MREDPAPRKRGDQKRSGSGEARLSSERKREGVSLPQAPRKKKGKARAHCRGQRKANKEDRRKTAENKGQRGGTDEKAG